MKSIFPCNIAICTCTSHHSLFLSVLCIVKAIVEAIAVLTAVLITSAVGQGTCGDVHCVCIHDAVCGLPVFNSGLCTSLTAQLYGSFMFQLCPFLAMHNAKHYFAPPTTNIKSCMWCIYADSIR